MELSGAYVYCPFVSSSMHPRSHLGHGVNNDMNQRMRKTSYRNTCSAVLLSMLHSRMLLKSSPRNDKACSSLSLNGRGPPCDLGSLIVDPFHNSLIPFTGACEGLEVGWFSGGFGPEVLD